MPTGGDSVPPPFPLVVTAWNPPLNALLGCAEVQAGIEAKALGVPAWGSHIQGDAVSLSEGPRTAVRGLASQQPCWGPPTSISSVIAHSTPERGIDASTPISQMRTFVLGHPVLSRCGRARWNLNWSLCGLRELCREDPGYADGGGRGRREGAGPDPGAHSGGVVPAAMQRLPSEPVDKAIHGPSLPQNEEAGPIGSSSPRKWEISSASGTLKTR